jgi:hypothetical protein
MTSKTTATLSKDEILASFQQLVEEKKKQDARVATKEEDASRAKDRQLVDAASTHTVENIVKGLADLQLSFGSSVDVLVTRLMEESSRLEELKRAIEIETSHVKQVNDVKLAADALHVLTLEHKEAIRTFEEQASQKRTTLGGEIEQTRLQWQQEQKQLEQTRRETEERQKKDRARGEADFDYELERGHKIEQDAFVEKKRKLERELAETGLLKEKLWAAREAVLAAHKADFDAHTARIAALPQELDEAVKKAREEAIKDAYSTEKVRSELLEKEVEANRKVYALQIQQLEDSVKKQSDQIEALSGQLATALREVQELALRAIEGTSRPQQPKALSR